MDDLVWRESGDDWDVGEEGGDDDGVGNDEVEYGGRFGWDGFC